MQIKTRITRFILRILFGKYLCLVAMEAMEHYGGYKHKHAVCGLPSSYDNQMDYVEDLNLLHNYFKQP